MEDVIIENKQAMEMTDIYHNILRSTMSLFGSIIDNNLNQVMKFLARSRLFLELANDDLGIVWYERQWCWNAVCDESIWVCSNLDFFFDRLFDRGVYFEEETYTIRY